MNEFRILVCGGRNYADAAKVNATLDNIVENIQLTASNQSVRLIHGAARGADSLAAAWASSRGLAATAYPAKWDIHGRSAGFVRNKQMLDEGQPHLVVAFPGGAGTAMMIRIARSAGVTVKEVI
jgi:hypothetical protein